MKVNYSYQNEMVIAQRKAFGADSEKKRSGNSFTKNLIDKSKNNLNELKKDEDKRYSVLAAGFAVSVLSVIGLVLLNGNKLLKLSEKKKYIAPRIKEQFEIPPSYRSAIKNNKQKSADTPNVWGDFVG